MLNDDYNYEFNQSDQMTESDKNTKIPNTTPTVAEKTSVEIMERYEKGKQLFFPAEKELKKIYNLKENEKLTTSMIFNNKPDNVDEEKFKKYVSDYLQGDELIKKAKEDVVDQLSLFIYYIIEKRFPTFKLYTKDLHQEGVVGILKGLDTYNPKKGKMTTFFYIYIVHEMTEFINLNINKTTSHYSSNIVKAKKAIDAFERAGRTWKISDIAQETGISAETIAQAINIMELSNEVHYESADYIDANLSAKSASPEEEYIKKEISELLNKAIDTLSIDEANVIRLKYGLSGEEPLSFKNIADRLGIQIDKVKKLNSAGIRKLKNSKIINGNFKNLQREEKALNENTICLVPTDTAEKALDELDEAFSETKKE